MILIVNPRVRSNVTNYKIYCGFISRIWSPRLFEVKCGNIIWRLLFLIKPDLTLFTKVNQVINWYQPRSTFSQTDIIKILTLQSYCECHKTPGPGSTAHLRTGVISLTMLWPYYD